MSILVNKPQLCPSTPPLPPPRPGLMVVIKLVKYLILNQKGHLEWRGMGGGRRGGGLNCCSNQDQIERNLPRHHTNILCIGWEGGSPHRRRMETEAKAKVVASVLGNRIYSISCHACCLASVGLEGKDEFNLFFSPKETRRPLPLLLSPVFFFGVKPLRIEEFSFLLWSSPHIPMVPGV